MSTILAVEPDRRQAAQIAAIVRHQVGAELVLADTTERALDALGARIPDLVLVPALLSPQDDAALAAALRVIAAAAHVRTLTIPVLASSRQEESRGGLLSRWRRKPGDAPAIDGCDPAVFAEQITAYLREAAAERAEMAERPEPLAAAAVDDAIVAEPAITPFEAPSEQFETTGAPLPVVAGMTGDADNRFELAGGDLLQPTIAEAINEEPPAFERELLAAHVNTAPGTAPGDLASTAFDVPTASDPATPEDAVFETSPIQPAAAFKSTTLFDAPIAFRRAPAQAPAHDTTSMVGRSVVERSVVEEPAVAPAMAAPPVVEPPVVATPPQTREEPTAFEASMIGDLPIVDEQPAPPPRRRRADRQEAVDAPIAAPPAPIDRPAAFVASETLETAATSRPPASSQSAMVGPTPLRAWRAWPPLEGVPIEMPGVALPAAARAETAAAPAPGPDWSELMASLRQDMARRRGQDSPSDKSRPRKRAKPLVDEWGFFDPEQCGFSALLAKLDEITSA